MNMDCIFFHYVSHEPVDLSHLTTTGGSRLHHTIFSPNHHFSAVFLGTRVHYYYICNVNILTPDHAPPDCHNAVGAHDHSEPPCFRHCRKQRESSRYPTLQIHRQRARPHPRPRLVRPRRTPLRPRNGTMERNGCLGGEILPMVAIRVVWG